MAATPQYGTFTFIGASKKTYTVDAYLSDVANELVRWDNGATGSGAATPEDWTPPENVMLVDYAQVTGTADTKKIQLLRNNAPTGDILRYVPHVSTNPNRPKLLIGFRAGTRIRALQLA